MKINILLPVIRKLYRLFSTKHKVYLAVLVVLTVGLSLVETLGISIIMPFISIASNPALLDSGWYKKAFDLSGIAEKNTFVIVFGIVIIIFYFFRAAYNAGHTFAINRFSQAIYKRFSRNLLITFLSIPYKTFIQRNSGELMHIITQLSLNVSHITLNVLQFGSEFFTILMIYTFMLAMNWKMTLVSTAVLSVIVFCILYIQTSKSKTQGVKVAEAGIKISKILRESFGNFKLVKLKGNEKTILEKYSVSLETYSWAHIINGFLNILPKTILESMGFSMLIAVVISILFLYKDASRVIPTISMYALALYRILPSIHKILVNFTNIAYHQKSLDIIDDDIHQPVENEGAAPVGFNKNIRLENVSFRYVTGGNVLNSVSLEICKGEKIAVTGESGCGKSTLADLIIGIHKPVSGSLYVDDTLITDENIRSWRGKIGYIPQSVYLFDGTVAENVAIGSEVDEAKIKQALQTANIWDFLAAKDGIHTLVGEGGVQLSGGQQQRIGIARALYDDPEVLVLDEATSALDTDTEKKIMEEIYSVCGNKTLIVIAHRLSTVKRCERKIRIENGTIMENFL
ncbi:MAG: ATP-binding cassette domain-containing protein [Treponema sp.]|jgi:ATP-binding cassette subfamily B protein/ATP-binding cassette subfamily C protein|nr:ATP-binding cassette domain-containing protein [Treponema sp.]